jgi:hypothetical protein
LEIIDWDNVAGRFDVGKKLTFIPCFLFIFTGAPYIEYLRGNKNLTTALSGITAAVVSVILNLGVWFTIHTLFGQVMKAIPGYKVATAGLGHT